MSGNRKRLLTSQELAEALGPGWRALETNIIVAEKGRISVTAEQYNTAPYVASIHNGEFVPVWFGKGQTPNEALTDVLRVAQADIEARQRLLLLATE